MRAADAVWGEESSMQRRKDRFKYSSGLLFYLFMAAGILIVAAGSLVQHYFSLKRPVFLPMHLELEMYREGNGDEDAGVSAGGDRYVWKEFPIYYIQDREDTSRVTELTFPQMEGLGEYWMTGLEEEAGLFHHVSGSMQDGRYQFKQLFIKMELPAGNLGKQGITLDTVKVRYSDGTEEVSIGSIVLTMEEPMEHVAVTGGSSSSDGTSMTRYLVQKDCRLEGFEVQNPELVKREFKVTVDGRDLWEWEPVELKKGDSFLVVSAWNGTGDVRERFEPYTALIQWKCSDDTGGKSGFTTNLDRRNDMYGDHFRQTYQYLKERGIKP